MIALACTTINGDAPALRENVSRWQGNAYVAFDRRTVGGHDLPARVLRFTDPPDSSFQRLCPWDSYARKNIAFIAAAADGASFIFETDDDNVLSVSPEVLVDACAVFEYEAPAVAPQDTVNLFADFYPQVAGNIWARGFPIEKIGNRLEPEALSRRARPGVLQFLVDGNPDVDAIFRLVRGAELDLQVDRERLPVSLAEAYHPINSQATLWPREMFPLMYLPASCPFRMADIWRGYIAQRVLHELNRSVVFDKPIVHQKRNAHSIHSDFFDELPGYRQAGKIIATLQGMELSGSIEDMLIHCYRRLQEDGIFDGKELVLVDEWCEAIR